MAYKLKNKKNRRKEVFTPFAVKLQRGVKSWRQWTEPMRKVRKKMLTQYAAGWYSENADESFEYNTSELQPLNMIDRYVSIIAPYLIANEPKVMVDPKRGLKASRSFSRTFELAIEHLFHEINFAKQTLRPSVVNSLFSMGITKTGIHPAEKVEVGGYLHDVGQIYSDSVDFEDYIGDWRARHREENVMEGNFYLLPEEFVKTSGLYKNTDSLCTEHTDYMRDTAPSRVSKPNRNLEGDAMQEIEKMVWLIDLWIPSENVIITIPPEGQGSKVLRTAEYDGPEGGPYDVLAFKYFPDTTIPIPEVFNALGLNNIINRLVRKMKHQAEREKKILVYETGAADDADLIRKEPDGGTVGIRNADGLKEIEFGGVSDTNMPFVAWLEQQFSIQNGNLYTIGGRSSQAETLGQEQILQANASRHLQDMVMQVHQFTRSIVRKMAWYLWSDPLIQVPVIKELGGFKLKVSYTPEVKEGDFFDYGFDIEPYSMTMMSPDMRYQRLMQLIGQVVLPTAEIAAQQGAVLNAPELVKEAARFLDVRNLDRWYQTSIPSETAMNPYQPMQGAVSGQSDGRFDNSESDNASNLNQHLNRTAGQGESRNAPDSKNPMQEYSYG